MSRLGRSYGTPMQANNDPKWAGRVATPAEISVAVADGNCKKSTNLVGIRMASDAAYQRRLIVADKQKLDDFQLRSQKQITMAKGVIDSLK